MATDIYDEVQVIPATLQAGSTGTLQIRFDCPSAKDHVKYLQFTVQYPEGWKVGTATLNQERVCDYDTEFEEYGDAKMTLNTTTEGTQKKYIIYSNTIDDAMNGQTGTLLTMKVQAPAGTPDGYYPINILAENSYYCIDADAAHNKVLGASTSYVKVGNPEGKTLVMTGTIPSFVNDALAAERGITRLDLSDVTASNGVFTYRAGREVTAPIAEVNARVKVVADAPASQFASICLPFTGNINCYTLGEVQNNYVLLNPATQLNAGTSAIIDTAIESSVEEDILRGVTAQVIESGAYLKNDKFFYVNGNATIPALRGYWELPAGVKGMIINTDGITSPLSATEGGAIYNVVGQRVPKAQRGVNIIETKKLLKK